MMEKAVIWALIAVLALLNLILLFNFPELIIDDSKYTELFFDNPDELPKQIAVGSDYELHFTVGNFEKRDVLYVYEIMLDHYGGEQELGSELIESGSFFLPDSEFKRIGYTFTANSTAERIRARVILVNKNQEISFLADMLD
jgi:hypothetical protein